MHLSCVTWIWSRAQTAAAYTNKRSGWPHLCHLLPSITRQSVSQHFIQNTVTFGGPVALPSASRSLSFTCAQHCEERASGVACHTTGSLGDNMHAGKQRSTGPSQLVLSSTLPHSCLLQLLPKHWQLTCARRTMSGSFSSTSTGFFSNWYLSTWDFSSLHAFVCVNYLIW